MPRGRTKGVLPGAAQNYTCRQCGKTLSSSSALQNHDRVHSGVKPFECEQCGRVFSQRSSLSVHKQTHSGLRPHVCSVCRKRFYQSSDLKRHMQSHLKHVQQNSLASVSNTINNIPSSLSHNGQQQQPGLNTLSQLDASNQILARTLSSASFITTKSEPISLSSVQPRLSLIDMRTEILRQSGDLRSEPVNLSPPLPKRSKPQEVQGQSPMRALSLHSKIENLSGEQFHVPSMLNRLFHEGDVRVNSVVAAENYNGQISNADLQNIQFAQFQAAQAAVVAQTLPKFQDLQHVHRFGDLNEQSIPVSRDQSHENLESSPQADDEVNAERQTLDSQWFDRCNGYRMPVVSSVGASRPETAQSIFASEDDLCLNLPLSITVSNLPSTASGGFNMSAPQTLSIAQLMSSEAAALSAAGITSPNTMSANSVGIQQHLNGQFHPSSANQIQSMTQPIFVGSPSLGSVTAHSSALELQRYVNLNRIRLQAAAAAAAPGFTSITNSLTQHMTLNQNGFIPTVTTLHDIGPPVDSYEMQRSISAEVSDGAVPIRSVVYGASGTSIEVPCDTSPIDEHVDMSHMEDLQSNDADTSAPTLVTLSGPSRSLATPPSGVNSSICDVTPPSQSRQYINIPSGPGMGPGLLPLPNGPLSFPSVTMNGSNDFDLHQRQMQLSSSMQASSVMHTPVMASCPSGATYLLAPQGSQAAAALMMNSGAISAMPAIHPTTIASLPTPTPSAMIAFPLTYSSVMASNGANQGGAAIMSPGVFMQQNGEQKISVVTPPASANSTSSVDERNSGLNGSQEHPSQPPPLQALTLTPVQVQVPPPVLTPLSTPLCASPSVPRVTSVIVSRQPEQRVAVSQHDGAFVGGVSGTQGSIEGSTNTSTSSSIGLRYPPSQLPPVPTVTTPILQTSGASRTPQPGGGSLVSPHRVFLPLTAAAAAAGVVGDHRAASAGVEGHQLPRAIACTTLSPSRPRSSIVPQLEMSQSSSNIGLMNNSAVTITPLKIIRLSQSPGASLEDVRNSPLQYIELASGHNGTSTLTLSTAQPPPTSTPGNGVIQFDTSLQSPVSQANGVCRNSDLDHRRPNLPPRFIGKNNMINL